MTTFKVRGLVLREYEAGESDKRLSILCKGRGRLMIYARGARKAKSKFLAASQILTYGDYIIADGRNFLSMAQAEVIENFYPIRQDYDLLYYAQYVLEVCEKTIPDRTPSDDLLLLAIKTLQHISKQKIIPYQSIQVFLFRFFLFYGLAPEMECCALCGTPAASGGQSDGMFCDEGIVCGRCLHHKTNMPLSIPAQEALRHILSTDLNHSFMFQAKEAVLNELAKAARLCWLGHFPITLQTEIH